MTQYFGAHTLQGEWHSLLPRYAALGERVRDKQVLDIGCGTGIGSSLLLEMGAQGVNGIDHRPEVLELARIKHAKQGLNFQVMFWEELEFPDDAFDVVLCLDPTSPVTDHNLLLEIKRVLRPGGEYVCAIERKPVEGLESLLPRYGYDTSGEELELAGTDQRVPQLGKLEEQFESIESVLQRPQFSFFFDPAESGSADAPDADVTDSEPSDRGPDDDVATDRRLADQNNPAGVQLLFCGDEELERPTPREIEMPYRQLVDRLHQLFGDLQVHRGPDEETTNVETSDDAQQFKDRRETSEFEPVSRQQHDPEPRTRPVPAVSPDSGPTDELPPEDPTAVPPNDRWQQVNQQLDRMTRMYQRIRDEMESLFQRTRRELAERDRYIEQLVDTVHRWKHGDSPDSDAPLPDAPASGVADESAGLGEPSGSLAESSTGTETTGLGEASDSEAREFERRTTSIFDRPSELETPRPDAESPETVQQSIDADDTDRSEEPDASGDDGEIPDSEDDDAKSESSPDSGETEPETADEEPETADEDEDPDTADEEPETADEDEDPDTAGEDPDTDDEESETTDEESETADEDEETDDTVEDPDDGDEAREREQASETSQ